MVLINSIKKSFNCVIENPSITLFLVLFLIGSNLLASCILTAKTRLIGQILIFSLFALMFVFFSGWLKVIKESTDREKIKEKNFYSLFLEGVGENIIPVSIAIILYTAAIFLVMILSQFIALKKFGDINFFMDAITRLTQENGNLAQYFNNLDDNQKYIVYGWNICIMLSVMIFNFISLFYFPAVFYGNKKIFLRPFVAIWDSLKFLFKNFFSAIGLSVFIYALNMVLAFLNAQFAQNVILSVLLLLIYIYFISYIVMLIFNYYEAKNNSNNRADSIREDKALDTVSEEN